MNVVEAAENDGAVAEIDRASDRVAHGSTAATERSRRLESLPTSLPVGGIITPV
jgi:hypothetical protein